MEFEEHGDQYGYDSIEHVCHLNYYVFFESLHLFLISWVVVLVEHPCDAVKPSVCHREAHVVSHNENVDEEQYEEFTIPKADTVINPWAMVIHVEYASSTAWAMMASLWLEYVAHQAVATTLTLCISQVETPEYRHLPRISKHWLEEGPQEHEEENMEYRQHCKCDWIMITCKKD